MEVVPTYAERERKKKRAKQSRISFHQRKSRKPQYVSKRKPVRDSTGVIRHAHAMKTISWVQFCARVELARSISEPQIGAVTQTPPTPPLSPPRPPTPPDTAAPTPSSSTHPVPPLSPPPTPPVSTPLVPTAPPPPAPPLSTPLSVPTAPPISAPPVQPLPPPSAPPHSPTPPASASPTPPLSPRVLATASGEAQATAVVDLFSSESEDYDDGSDDGDTIVDCTPPAGSTHWPDGSNVMIKFKNRGRVQFPDLGDLGDCSCVGACTAEDRCHNIMSEMFCTDLTCAIDGECGNRGTDAPGLRLCTGRNGYTVFTSQNIAEGAVIGTYWGEITTHDFEADTEQTSDYAMKLKLKPHGAKKAYIDAAVGGSISRFINHSCDADACFVERRNRRSVRAFVVAVRDIPAGKEVTVDYGPELWFTCRCGSENCRDKGK